MSLEAFEKLNPYPEGQEHKLWNDGLSDRFLWGIAFTDHPAYNAGWEAAIQAINSDSSGAKGATQAIDLRAVEERYRSEC